MAKQRDGLPKVSPPVCKGKTHEIDCSPTCADASAILIHAYTRPEEDARDKRTILLRGDVFGSGESAFRVPAARKSVGNKRRQWEIRSDLRPVIPIIPTFSKGPSVYLSRYIHYPPRAPCASSESTVTHARARSGFEVGSERRNTGNIWARSDHFHNQPAINTPTTNHAHTERNTRHVSSFSVCWGGAEGSKGQRGRTGESGARGRDGRAVCSLARARPIRGAARDDDIWKWVSLHPPRPAQGELRRASSSSSRYSSVN